MHFGAKNSAISRLLRVSDFKSGLEEKLQYILTDLLDILPTKRAENGRGKPTKTTL